MRWRLTAAHYLKVPGTEWEHKETSRETGKQARRVFPVPALLNPDDPADCNYPGEIIVCHEGKGQGRDITFEGEPTPDMEPLDDEAKKLSAELAPKWQHPIDTLPGNGQDYSQMLIKMFEKQMLQAQAANPVSLAGVDPSKFEELQKQVQQLVQQNAQLVAQLAKSPDQRRA